MATDLHYSCRCGTVRGVLRDAGPRKGDRYVCHCHDCRDIVRLCGREADMLEHAGGVSLYQTRIGLFTLDAGADRLACVHMTDKPLLRWYTTCCETPLFHTMHSGRFPFVTVLDRNCDAESREAVLGPSKGHVFPESATEPLDDNIPRASFARGLRRFLRRLLQDYLTGDHRRSPLFKRGSRRPIATPRRLSVEEEQALGRPQYGRNGENRRFNLFRFMGAPHRFQNRALVPASGVNPIGPVLQGGHCQGRAPLCAANSFRENITCVNGR